MTVSMWNTALGRNGLNKSESFITVLVKANPIQIGPFHGSQKLMVGRRRTRSLCWGDVQEAYVGTRGMKPGKRV